MFNLKGIADKVNNLDAKEKFNFIQVNINDLIPSENNFYGIREIEELAASIKENGLMHNLVVRALENGKYEIISGERRYRALKSLGYEKIPCQVKNNLGDLDAEIMLIQANVEQRELLPSEKMEGIRRLKAIYEQKKANGEELPKGKTRDLIGKDMKLSGVQVGRYQKIDKDLIPELKDKLDKEDITLTQAHTLSSLTKKEQKIIHDEIKDLNTNDHKLEVDILVQSIKQPIERKEDKELLDEMHSKSASKKELVVSNGTKISDEKENSIEYKPKYVGTIREQIAKIAEYDPHPTIIISNDKITSIFYYVDRIDILEKEIRAFFKDSVLDLYTKNILESTKIPGTSETAFKLAVYKLNDGTYLYFKNYDKQMKQLMKRGFIELDNNI